MTKKFKFQVGVTTSRLPNRQTFVDRPEFCVLVKKLRHVCGHEDARWKRIELDAQYPNLCPTLEEIRGEWARAKAGNGTAGKSGSDEDAAFCGFITSRHHAFSLNQVGPMWVVGR